MLLYRRLRNLRRLREISRILVRYGFGYALLQLGVDRLIPISRWRARVLRREYALSPAERLRVALGELGPTFIKLGQALSSRYDLLPQSFVHELRKLQDEAPPVPYRAVASVVEAEFGASPEEVFASFEVEPVSSASIGQVHGAVTKDGRRVVVKVQRPGVMSLVETDLAIMADAANFLHVRSRALRRYDLPAFVREFSAIIRDELRYRIEAHNAQTIRDNLRDFEWVQVPQVVWELTTQRVLTLERLSGVRIDNVDEIRKRGFDLPLLAARFAQCVVAQVFVNGFFHGDPHQGNVWVTPDGGLALLDFGSVGRLDRTFRRSLIDLVLALRRQDSKAALDDIAVMGMMGQHQEVTMLRHDLRRLFTRYYFLPRREFPFGDLFVRVVQIMSNRGVPVSWEFSLIAKALAITEGICHELDPAFDFDEAAQPVIERLRRERFSPHALAEEVVEFARDIGRDLAALPDGLNQVLSQLRRGTLRLRVSDEEVDHVLAHHTALYNRISLALILSALEVATALFLVSPVASTTVKLWVGIPVAVIAGIAIVLLLGGAAHPRD